MKNAFHLLALISLTIVAGFAVASAQDASPGIELSEIRKRAAEHTGDAEALAASVRARADLLAKEAELTQQTALLNRSSYAETAKASTRGGPLDLDGMVRAQADAEARRLGETPRFIAFASLSMPPAALKALAHDMTKAGGVTVLRGFPQGNSEAFKKRLAEIWSDSNEAGSLGIDPRLFRAFEIKAAPSFVMLSTDFVPCDGFDCTSSVPPHDRIAGNISVEEVLETFVSGRGPGADLARLHRNRLQGAPQ